MDSCFNFVFVLQGWFAPALGAVAGPPQPRGGDAPPIATTITEVSVHQGSALVTRRGEVPDGGGRFVVSGLSGELLADSVRLKLEGGEANGVEVHETSRATVPQERLATLQRRWSELVRNQEVANDQLSLERALRARLEGLLDQEAGAHAREVAGGHSNETAWSTNYTYLSEQLLAAKKAERAAQWTEEDARADRDAAAAELGQLQTGGSVRTFEIVFDVVALRHGTLPLEVDYLVSHASWAPRYDLRADKELAKVDLIYRAEVSQQTGEDWSEVDLYLSTAQPQRGVTGPEARTVWLSLAQPQWRGRLGERLRSLGYVAAEKKADKGDFDADGAANSWSAEVNNEGLSVRYHLTRKETIESRPGAATVLVGKAALQVTGERVCTPAIDKSVWLRGRTKNTSDYVMLPGPSAVFFGNDFVGQSSVALVRPGQEFTLHLGLDAGLTVERTHVEDQTGTAGFFRSKKEQVDRWRIVIENHGALAAAADGGVKVQVREVLPKAKDDRIEVELTECTPPLATGGLFDRDREEQGVLTWEVGVAKGGKAEIDWQSRIVWPDDFDLSHSGGAVLPSGPPGSAGMSQLLIGLYGAVLVSLAVMLGVSISRCVSASRAGRVATVGTGGSVS